ncbi:MAG: winged helix-turn-helix domain-containing protein [Pseudomonadota bacterium]
MSRKPSIASTPLPRLPGTPYGKQVRARLWITGPRGGYLGLGKVALLEAIAEKGSISQAAKAMGMSYKRAWQLVEELNALSESPMVLTETGGLHGGGTRLTERGERAIRCYRELESEFASFVEKTSQSFDI